VPLTAAGRALDLPVMAEPLAIRDLRDDERDWADERYRAIRFATTPPGSVALVAERGGARVGARVGLGRLVAYPGGVVELGGIWTDEAARGGGVARAMVTALLGGSTCRGIARLWCVPFAHLAAFYRSFGFAPVAPPWPPPIAAKVDECIAHALPDVVVLTR
jgi:GNAT superfamily N-acetyltransferase